MTSVMRLINTNSYNHHKVRQQRPKRWLCCFGIKQSTTNYHRNENNQEENKDNKLELFNKKCSFIDQYEYNLLPPQFPLMSDRNSLVIDLDETLVHSSFEPVSYADFVIPIESDGDIHEVFVAKRPFVDLFLKRMAELFECILFTASLQKYANSVVDKLNHRGVFTYRLFRDACIHKNGVYIKNLDMLGRSLSRLIILDNSPSCYSLHPQNAIAVNSWFDDPNDTELLDLMPFMEKIALASDVRIFICR